VVTQFVVKANNNNQKDAKSSKVDIPSYVYVNFGFFDLVWFPVLYIQIAGHLAYAYGTYLLLTGQSWPTLMTTAIFSCWAYLGVMAGSHRLWCHRGYEAKTPLRIFLMIGQTMSGQYSIYGWARGHRTHHKYADSDADPHNVKRGFFFSHMGWTFKKEHPLVDLKGKNIDFSDIIRDPVVRFQEDHYVMLYFLLAIVLPCALPVYLFNDTIGNALTVAWVMRYMCTIHGTWLVNSAGHMFGERPYNNKLPSAENPWVAAASFGEGYHNYHHAYPWDYGAGEHGNYFNPTKVFIDQMAKIGLAFNLRQASDELIRKSRERVLNNTAVVELAY
jgi:stearoyl-CoA desaturase (delta-9 desaturase)